MLFEINKCHFSKINYINATGELNMIKAQKNIIFNNFKKCISHVM